jgi:hypothetical protein
MTHEGIQRGPEALPPGCVKEASEGAAPRRPGAARGGSAAKPSPQRRKAGRDGPEAILRQAQDKLAGKARPLPPAKRGEARKKPRSTWGDETGGRSGRGTAASRRGSTSFPTKFQGLFYYVAPPRRNALHAAAAASPGGPRLRTHHQAVRGPRPRCLAESAIRSAATRRCTTRANLQMPRDPAQHAPATADGDQRARPTARGRAPTTSATSPASPTAGIDPQE